MEKRDGKATALEVEAVTKTKKGDSEIRFVDCAGGVIALHYDGDVESA